MNPNPNKISSDDPRLTAYALDEMEPAERSAFEQVLAQDAIARQMVAEIHATAATVTTALAGEPLPVTQHDFAAAGILPGNDPRKLDGGPLPTKGWLAKPIKFPQFYYIVSGLAAACFAVVFALHEREEALKVHTHLIEVPLTAPVAELQKEKKEEAVPGQVAEADTTAGRKDTLTSVAIGMPVIAAPSREPAPMDLPTAAPAASLVSGQLQVPESPAAAKVAWLDNDEKTIVLSPFEVTASNGSGYKANNTLAGARVGTMLKDISGASTIVASRDGQEVRAGSARRMWGGLNFGIVGGLGGRLAQQKSGANGDANTEAYDYHKDNDYLRVADQPLSTFSVDVDTASYANVRRFLMEGQRPPADAVRIEELVNYFPYAYAGPETVAAQESSSASDRSRERGSSVTKARADKEGIPPTAREAPPFAAHLEVADAPWAPEHRLVRIGLKGREVSDASRPAANLVFLLDVSGSMDEPNKLPLVKQSLRLLVEKLRSDDRVAIVIYAGASGLALPSTSAAHKTEILDAIDRLQAEGSTNGAMGIQLAYDIAKANFVSGGVNRIILATDGDFNVGVTSEGGLVRLVEEKAKSGVYLTVLGFGMGNFKDSTLEQLADKGNGNYAYIDSLAEARKALVEQAGGTLVTIAKDVKIQVEFNPATVQAYRLIGYENRLLAKEDFNNDKVDAGEIGAGHTVTALYEVVPAGVAMPNDTPAVDALKYTKTQAEAGNRERGAGSKELLTVKIRYKDPADSRLAAQRLAAKESNAGPVVEESRKLEFPLRDTGERFADASPDFQFAAAVAAFGMVLRDSPHKGTVTLAEVAAWGRDALGSDAGGYRNEFIGLVERARQILQ